MFYNLKSVLILQFQNHLWEASRFQIETQMVQKEAHIRPNRTLEVQM